jgi:hypothetical protein
MIGFALKSAFWLTVVLLLLPEFGGGERGSDGAGEVDGAAAASASAPATPGTADALAFVSGAVADVATFCQRQPAACEGGARFASAMGSRVKEGAMTLADLLEREMIAGDADRPAPGATDEGAVLPDANGTLRASDIEPQWRGPSEDAAPAALPRIE